MKSVLVISSLVAGSNIGGSLAMKVLPVLGHEVSLLPTTLLGRHPGWGAPGGGAVPQALFEGMAQGLLDNQIPQSCDVVLTGYFASAEQVSFAARMIRENVTRDTVVIVDTIMGDFGKGLYVKEEVAEAIVRELIPLASIVKGNAWEFWEVERRLGRVAGLPEAPQALTGLQDYSEDRQKDAVMRVITSVTERNRVGLFAMQNAEAVYAGVPAKEGGILPNGLGDFVSLMLLREAAKGTSRLSDYIGPAMSATHLLIAEQDGEILTELNLYSLHSVLTASSVVEVQPVS